MNMPQGRLFKSATMIALSVFLFGCEPAFQPASVPGKPCPEISKEEYERAIAAGATGAKAVISSSGVVSMETGPGVKQCATFKSAIKPCRRPNDFVIRYTLADGKIIHVKVTAGREYRLRVQGRPTTCEIVNE